MIDIDKWQEILGALANNKLRTFLTALGVFWGIMMLVLLLGSGNGLRTGVVNNFSGYAVNSIYVWPQKTTLPYKGLKPGRYAVFRNGDVEAIKNNVPEVAVVAPRIQLGGWRDGNNVSRNNKYGNFQVMGDYPEFIEVQVMDISVGRFLNQIDLSEKRKVCVIGEQVMKEMFLTDEEPLGSYIKIQGVYFMVVGLFKSTKKRGDDADRDARTIFIPFSTFQQAFNYGDRFGWFSLKAAEGVPALIAENKVKQILMSRHNISPEDTRAIGSFNAEKEAKKFMGLFGGIQMFVWLVGLGTLLAGAIGVSNIMLIVVNERTKEIGIRKAVGATPVSIISMILMESVLLTTFAGYLGIVVGVGLLEAANYLMNHYGADSGFFKNPEIEFTTALIATGILVVSGALAGLMPALKAVSINPILALRAE